jgi:7-cyano-7-deazaguanine reductase
MKALGNPEARASRELDTFPNTADNLLVKLHCTEFTCRCPVTGQPDWATIDIVYRPGERILESKSIKLYLETYREEGIFHEHLAQKILTDLVQALGPAECSVTVHFNVRGGIAIDATASYARPAAQS